MTNSAVRNVHAALTALATMAMTLAFGVSTAVSAPAHCTRGDVQAIAQAGPQFGTRVLGVQPHGESAASTRKWVDCQFRLYDDNDENDPEVPHVFSEDDWIVGGVAPFIFYSEFPLVGGSRRSATAYMDTWTTRFYFGPASLADAELPEVSLTETSYADAQFPALGDRVVWKQVYVIFPAGSLAPGTYRFRSEDLVPDGFLAGEGVARGLIVITAAP